MMILTDDVKGKMDGVVDSFPPEGCGVLDGEVTNEEWDKNGYKNVADSDDTRILIKWGSI